MPRRPRTALEKKREANRTYWHRQKLKRKMAETADNQVLLAWKRTNQLDLPQMTSRNNARRDKTLPN